MKRKPAHKSTTQTGLVGEYLVLAELARRDAIASMTLGNSKGVDILVAPADRHVAYKVEVKTARNQPTHAHTWHGEEFCPTAQYGLIVPGVGTMPPS